MTDEKCALRPERDCLGLQKANMLEKQMDEYRRQARETHREIFGRLGELEQAESAWDQQYRQIMEKLDKLLLWQEEQQKKPAKRWEAVVEKLVLLVVTAAAAFFMGRLGI